MTRVGKLINKHNVTINVKASDWEWLVAHAKDNYLSASGVIRRLIEVYRDAIELEAQDKLPADLRGWLERVRIMLD